MPYTIKCPYCKELLKVEEAWAGMESTCPSCHQRLTIPPLPHAACNRASYAGCTPPVDDYKVLAISSLMITAFCCPGLGLVLAIIAHSKMRKSGIYTYRPVCIATYVIFSFILVYWLFLFFRS